MLRTFAKSNKFAKGAVGKESSLGSNFSFPRHKELFTEGYYDGEGDSGENYQDNSFESPYSKQMA